MKKGQIFEGNIIKTDFPNKSIVKIIETDKQGVRIEHLVLVKGGIPGQKVKISIKKTKKNKCQGILREVLAFSDLETNENICRYSDICGGCCYQRIPYDKQIEIKKNQVMGLLNPVFGNMNDFKYDGILSSPQAYGYRNKMEFSFGDEIKDGPLTLGLHKKNSFHDIIDVPECMIVHADYGKVINIVKGFAVSKGWKHYNKKNHIGFLRHLLVRRSQTSGELLIALVTSSQYDDEKALLIELQELSCLLKKEIQDEKIAGFIHIVNDSQGDVVKSDRLRILFGNDYFEEKLLGLSFKISLFSFFQTNTMGAEVLYTQVRKYITDNENVKEFRKKTVFDLYSGTGTIAQIIAPIAKKVIGVEIVEEAVEAAKENAKLNNLDNCEFIAGDVLKVIDFLDEKPDFIILDPPRDGIHPKAIKKIIAYNVDKIIYISCKPTSLARDLKIFLENGYKVERMCNVDMFPQTYHVETVVLMSRVKE